MRAKNCSKCKEKKTRSFFYNNSASKDGKDNLCIECRKIINRAYRDMKNNDVKKELITIVSSLYNKIYQLGI